MLLHFLSFRPTFHSSKKIAPPLRLGASLSRAEATPCGSRAWWVPGASAAWRRRRGARWAVWTLRPWPWRPPRRGWARVVSWVMLDSGGAQIEGKSNEIIKEGIRKCEWINNMINMALKCFWGCLWSSNLFLWFGLSLVLESCGLSQSEMDLYDILSPTCGLKH